MLENIEEVAHTKVSRGFFGEYELLFSMPRQFTVKALEHSEVLFLDVQDFQALFTSKSHDLDFVEQFSNSAAIRMAKMHESNDRMRDYITRKAFWRIILKPFRYKQKKKTAKWLQSMQANPSTPRSAMRRRQSDFSNT